MIPISQCTRCIRLRHNPPGVFGRRCDAFPDGAPDDIVFNRHYHITPYPGDNGILFEQHPDKPKLWNGEYQFMGKPCRWCKHKNPLTRENPDIPGALLPTCDAFPDGIPIEIQLNRHKHRKPYPGDNGILFEPDGSEESLEFMRLPL